MEQFTLHGPLSSQDIAEALVADFHQGNLRVRTVGKGENIVVQIASIVRPASGGRTGLTIHLTQIEDGVRIDIGEQEWTGIAASLGLTVLGAILRPSSLLGRIDDVAQDITSLQLQDEVIETIRRVADSLGASHQLSERLRRLTCAYCQTANPVGEPSCIACGAPLGPQQPIACPHCGYVSSPETKICPECKKELPQSD
ncbi:MAG: hypothetical protein GTO18_09330 [Anaerolineales bacterium]|nr:hypothetical protein [Anaerolineales bacterium]